MAPVVGALAGSVGAIEAGCIEGVGAGVVAGGEVAKGLTVVNYFFLVPRILLEQSPIFLDSLQITPDKPQLAVGQTTPLDVEGHFVPAPSAKNGLTDLIGQIIEDAITVRGLPGLEESAGHNCPLCAQILKTCPQCQGALTEIGKELFNDLVGIVLDAVKDSVPDSPALRRNLTGVAPAAI